MSERGKTNEAMMSSVVAVDADVDVVVAAAAADCESIYGWTKLIYNFPHPLQDPGRT